MAQLFTLVGIVATLTGQQGPMEPLASRECQKAIIQICGLGDPRDVLAPKKPPLKGYEMATLNEFEVKKAKRKHELEIASQLATIENLGTCIEGKRAEIGALCREDLLNTVVALVEVRTHTGSAVDQKCQDFVKERCAGLSSHLEDESPQGSKTIGFFLSVYSDPCGDSNPEPPD